MGKIGRGEQRGVDEGFENSVIGVKGVKELIGVTSYKLQVKKWELKNNF